MANPAIGEAQQRKLFQGIRCGSLRIALPYGWAEAIVDSFELTNVPRAPAWLVGATNLTGRIVPVLDLSLLRVRSDALPLSRDKDSASTRRLLVGALDRDGGRERIALAFDGMPQQLEEADAHDLNPSNALIEGFIEGAQGERFGKVNVERLLAELTDAIDRSQ